MDLRTSVETSVDKRRLVAVVCTPPSDDPANTPPVEVIFQVLFPQEDDYTIHKNTAFLTQLSCTRIDTREATSLTHSEWQQVLKAASIAAASDADEPW